MRIDVYIHFEEPAGTSSLTQKLGQIIAGQQELKAIMTQGFKDITAELGRINAATNDLAADIKELTNDIKTGMSAAEVTGVKAALSSTATALEDMASAYPVGPAPVEPPVEPPVESPVEPAKPPYDRSGGNRY